MRGALLALLMLAACEKADRGGDGPAGATVIVPPALPGEPPIGADREDMLRKFAANISQGLYTKDNLLFLVCSCEAGKRAADQSGDAFSIALMRRMVVLFRSAPGMANASCPQGASP